jgi:hypothetical protein
MDFLILRSKHRRVVSVLLLSWRHVFRRSSLGLEHLSSLDLFFGHNLLSGLSLLELLFKVLLLGLCILDFLDLLVLEDTEYLFGVLLGLLDGIFGNRLFLYLALIDLIKNDLVLALQGVLSVLTALSGLFKLLSLSLCLLDDDIDELSSLLNSYLHLNIEGISHLSRLGLDICRSSFSGSRKSVLGSLTNSLGVLKLSQLFGFVQLLLDGLEGDRRGCLWLHQSLDDLAFRGRDRFLEGHFDDDGLFDCEHLLLKVVFDLN